MANLRSYIGMALFGVTQEFKESEKARQLMGDAQHIVDIARDLRDLAETKVSAPWELLHISWWMPICTR